MIRRIITRLRAPALRRERARLAAAYAEARRLHRPSAAICARMTAITARLMEAGL